MILTRFYGIKKGDPSDLRLEQVPRVNDEITLDDSRVYRAKSVRWQLTSAGLREACLDLEFVEDVRI